MTQQNFPNNPNPFYSVFCWALRKTAEEVAEVIEDGEHSEEIDIQLAALLALAED